MLQTIIYMKKLPLIAVLAIFGSLLVASCKKDYKCTCNVSVPLAGFDTTIITNFEDMKKKEAKHACDGSEQTLEQLFMGLAQVNCDI